MKPRPNYEEHEPKKMSTTNPINKTKTKLQKTRKNVKQRKTITTQSMAMLKLNKTKYANKNKEKNANIPSVHHLSWNVPSSARRKRSALNKVKIHS